MADANTARTNDRLDGGTQGHDEAPFINVGGPPGGTNSLSPKGNVHVDEAPDQRGTANKSREDAAAAFEGSRHPSTAEAKQWARDEVDSDTTCGTPFGGVAPDRQVHKMQGDDR